MRLPIFLLLLVVSLCTAASADILPPVTPVDMYTISTSAPARIATGSDGKLYVTEPYHGLVNIYANNGLLLKSVQTCLYPIGIAVDSSKRLYVSDSKGNYVGVYSEDGNLLHMLGDGEQEFGFPNDIAIYENAGWVYVTDSSKNEVRKYSLQGDFLSSFGSDLLSFPTGIAVDADAEEVYVLDHDNIYIRIYDLHGNLKRSISAGGSMFGGGVLLRPLGIAVDSTYFYITDAYDSVVAVYSKGGMFLKRVGNYGSGLGELKTPIDVALDKDGKMFVTNTENQRLEVFGIAAFTGLKITPDTLHYSVIANGLSNTQSVNLTSTGTETSWTVTTGASWIMVSPGSGTTPSAVYVTVDPSGMSAGNYSTNVVFKTPSGTEYVLPVTAEVRYVGPELSVSPSSLKFKYYRKSDTLQSGSIILSSNGPILKWNAKASRNWLTIDKTSGTAPDTLTVSLSESVKNLGAGSYNATVVVDAGNIPGSPAIINVNLEVINPGTIRVMTNLDGAGFTITGPESYNGSGKLWTDEKAKPGNYEIHFGHVSGYKKPYSRSFMVRAGNTVEISGMYTQKPRATHLIAGSGGSDGNLLKVVPLNGGSEFSIAPFDTPSAVKVSSGDMDGDGIDEIIVTNGKNIIKIFNAEGNEIAVKKLPINYDKLEIALADLNGDGKAEIIAGYLIPGSKMSNVISLRLENGSRLVQLLIMRIRGIEPFAIASGDVNGDGYTDLMISQKSFIAAFDIQKRPALMWINRLEETVRPNLSAGDINDDGIDEILLASGPDQNNSPFVRILYGNGTEYGLEINALADYKHGANAAAGIVDGGATCNIAVGAGPGPENEALISFYSSSGEYIETIRAMESLFGVNVSFGKLER